ILEDCTDLGLAYGAAAEADGLLGDEPERADLLSLGGAQPKAQTTYAHHVLLPLGLDLVSSVRSRRRPAAPHGQHGDYPLLQAVSAVDEGCAGIRRREDSRVFAEEQMAEEAVVAKR